MSAWWYKISFGDNVNISMFSRIACINEISIGNNILTEPHIFISNYNYVYDDITKSISAQGNMLKTNKVIIDDDYWIGTNVVMCGNVHITTFSNWSRGIC